MLHSSGMTGVDVKNQRIRRIATWLSVAVVASMVIFSCRPTPSPTYGEHSLDFWLASPDQESGGINSVEMLVNILQTIDIPLRSLVPNPQGRLSSLFQGTLARDLDYEALIAGTHQLVPTRINEISDLLEQASMSSDAQKRQDAIVGLKLVQRWRNHPTFGPRCTPVGL
ncbi:MAG: hypothetical protein AB8G99_05360 [Planctomycetaceae bacterium]